MNPVLVRRICGSSHLAVVLGTHSNHGAFFFVQPPQVFGGQVPEALASICSHHQDVILSVTKNLEYFANLPWRDGTWVAMQKPG